MLLFQYPEQIIPALPYGFPGNHIDKSTKNLLNCQYGFQGNHIDSLAEGDTLMTESAVPEGKRLLEAAFQAFIATGVMPVKQYFAPEYQQWADGEQLDYQDFVQHMQALSTRRKQGYVFENFIIDETVTEGNTFVSRHRMIGKTPDGQPFTVKVLALFKIHDGRFTHCWELSHTEGGSEADKSLASTRK